MNHHDTPQDEPAEHLRFRAYLSALEHVTDADEAGLVSEVLNDPDQTMARSAVLRHLDRRATELHPGPAYEPWAASMAQATVRHAFLTRRLQEWSLFRAITLGQPWRPDTLLDSSDWLQLKAAASSNTEAVKTLAERGRTKRIRNTARTNPRRQGSH
ncbi:hypothetical protein [Streptomyces sp. SPB4]|uniref:hypothetical protein n=1 Tax=Streptomyces sp. SPB4 TaxID=2940553 RepID=UPI002474E142|nr:hypothetical protein [Streptomyces sp. SPB4]MDH6539915.1 hypothetical protein [Streptomyces sp. SPB4]